MAIPDTENWKKVLLERRWGVPVMGLLWERKGERFVALMRGLGASQKATRETLDDLMSAGLVARNTGYGHPLRPEYVLTEVGVEVGQLCHALDALVAAGDLSSVYRSKWSFRVIPALASGPLRFGELRDHLEPITDRALIMCLKGLIQLDVVERAVEPTFPVQVKYALAPAGARILEPLQALLSRE